jgi:hypothetical protein
MSVLPSQDETLRRTLLDGALAVLDAPGGAWGSTCAIERQNGRKCAINHGIQGNDLSHRELPDITGFGNLGGGCDFWI